MASGAPAGDESATSAPCPGRRRDKEATKRALLDAASQIFAERGYDAATTREVAQKAGVNEQLIQRYFGGKEGLLLTLIRKFGNEEQQSCSGAPVGDSVEDEIFGFLKHHLEHACTVGNMSKVALQRSLCDSSVAREIGQQLTESRVPLLRRRLEALRERGLINDEADLDAAATVLSSLSFGLSFVDQLVFGADCQKLQHLARHVAKIYAAGLAPRAARPS